MNILIVSQCFYPDNFRINDIARSLVESGHNVRVLTGLPDYTTSKVPKEYRFFKKRRDDWHGVQVVRVPTIARRSGVFFRALNYVSFVFAGWFYSLFCSKDVDVVFSYQTSPVLQAIPAVSFRKHAKVPLLLYCCDLWPESLKAWNVTETHPLFRYMKRISQRIYTACDMVAITSTPFRDYLREVNGVADERIVYLPQHAEDLYSSIQGQYEQNNCIDFLFAGNIGAVQNVDCIIRAVADIQTDKPFCVHIVGAGSEMEQCVSLAQQLKVNDRVIFHGKYPLSEMNRFYKLADCFVLTLRGGDFIGKTLPAKMQGYLSAGKPVVAAADGAAADVIRKADCGECVPAGDVKGLANIMLAVINNFDKYKIKGSNGRIFFETHYTKDIFMHSLTDLLNDTVKRWKRS